MENRQYVWQDGPGEMEEFGEIEGEEQPEEILQVYTEDGTRFTEEFVRNLYSRDFSIVIPTFNGLSNLEQTLPPLFEAIADYEEGRVEVIILNNASTDKTEEFIKNNVEGIQVIRSNKQKGLCSLLNDGIAKTKYDLVMVMEDDVLVSIGFMRPLLVEISDEDIFAVVPRIELKWKNNEVISVHLLKYIDNQLRVKPIPDGNFPEPVYIPGVIGTAFMMKKDIFNQLEGFDTMFDPYYYQDLDLGYRAWKRGHKVLYSRRSVISHIDRDPFRDLLENQEADWLKERNYLLFMGKNITHFGMYMKHRLTLFKKIALAMLGLSGDKLILTAWKESSKYHREMSRNRKIEKRESYFSDKDLLRIFASHPDNRLGMR